MAKKKKPLLDSKGRVVRDVHGDIVYEGDAFIDIHHVFHGGTDDYQPPDYSDWYIYHPPVDTSNPYTPTQEELQVTLDRPPEEGVGPFEQDFDYLTREQFYQKFSSESTLLADLYMLSIGVSSESGQAIHPPGTPGTLKNDFAMEGGLMVFDAGFGNRESNPATVGGVSLSGALWGYPEDWVYEEYRRTGVFPTWQKTFGIPGGGLFGLGEFVKARRESKKSWGDLDIWRGPKE